MIKTATCNRTEFPLVTSENIGWPMGINAGTLSIYQYASGLPADTPQSEIITWANVNADHTECQEIETTAAFEKAKPKYLPFLMKYTKQAMIRTAKCSRIEYPYRVMWDKTTGGNRYIYSKVPEPIGFSIIII